LKRPGGRERGNREGYDREGEGEGKLPGICYDPELIHKMCHRLFFFLLQVEKAGRESGTKQRREREGEGERGEGVQITLNLL
jgi:hypothetical protein